MACIITRDRIVTQDVAWIIPLEIEAVVVYSNNSLFDLISSVVNGFTWDYTMFDLHNFCSQGKNLVTDSMKIISIIADAVLTIKVPDEEMTSIKTTELAMTLGRHTPAKLAGLTIEGGDGRFIFPVEKETLESSISGTSFVDTQVNFHLPSLFSHPNLVMLVKSLWTSDHIIVRHFTPPPPPPPPITSPTLIIN